MDPMNEFIRRGAVRPTFPMNEFIGWDGKRAEARWAKLKNVIAMISPLLKMKARTPFQEAG
jgi:hypothetical protein